MSKLQSMNKSDLSEVYVDLREYFALIFCVSSFLVQFC